MNNYSIEESMRMFMNEVESCKIVNIDDEAQQKLIIELKRCIKFDVEIQRLIQIGENLKFNFEDKSVKAYVNLVNLHNFSIAKYNDDPGLEGIHMDNMGLYTFEFLEDKLEKTSIYVPKRKAKLDKWDIREVSYDRLLEEFDNIYYQSERLSDDSKKEKKDRPSLSPKQIDLLKRKDSISFTKYYDFISRQYPKTVGEDAKDKEYITAWYTSIDSANVMSFLLFYNKPFKLPYHLFDYDDDTIEKSIKKLKIKNKKITTSNAIRALIYNIMFFIDDKHLNNYLEDNNYHRAVYVDKVIFLAKIDYLFNWILFSSCFSDCPLYLKNDADNTFFVDFASEYLMRETSYPNKKKENAINHLFFTKWYFLALIKFVKYYSTSNFIKLLDSITEYYNEISKNLHQSKEDMLSDLYQSKDMLDMMIIYNMEKESEVNFSLLLKLSSIYCKKVSQIIKIKNLNEFVSTFSSLINSNFEKVNMNLFKLELCKYILKDITIYIEQFNESTLKINKDVILKHLNNNDVRLWIDDSFDYIKEDMLKKLCKNEFEKVLVKELIETVRYNPFGLDDLIKEYFDQAIVEK